MFDGEMFHIFYIILRSSSESLKRTVWYRFVEYGRDTDLLRIDCTMIGLAFSHVKRKSKQANKIFHSLI